MPRVKCPVCLQHFKTEEVAYEFIKNRYYHSSCCSEEFLYTEKTFILLKKAWNVDKVNRSKITKQIDQFKIEHRYTMKEIYEDLFYFFEIKKSDNGKYQNTIGIVPFIHKEARAYYLKTIESNEKKEIVLKQLEEYSPQERVIYIRKQERKKLSFELEEE